jgi:hypothetical protein
VTQRSLAEAESDRGVIYRIRTYPAVSEASLELLPGVDVIGNHEDTVTVRLADIQRLGVVLEALRGSGLQLLELVQEHSSLRDLYLASGGQGE